MSDAVVPGDEPRIKMLYREWRAKSESLIGLVNHPGQRIFPVISIVRVHVPMRVGDQFMPSAYSLYRLRQQSPL